MHSGPDAKRIKSKVPERFKAQLKEKPDHLIQSVLKPEHIKPPPKDTNFNYIVDIYPKWYHSYLYFCATYRCPSPNAISEFFESKFARLEYTENERFSLSYMRHTGQWVELLTEMTLAECLTTKALDLTYSHTPYPQTCESLFHLIKLKRLAGENCNFVHAGIYFLQNCIFCGAIILFFNLTVCYC